MAIVEPLEPLEPRSLGAFSNIELRHLAALDAVAAEGTFGRAAAVLGYTQSAVSQQIAALEKTVGGAVFDRPGGPKPVSLTPLGRVVLSHARELIDRARAAADAIERFRAGESGRVGIGTFQSISNTILPDIVRRLRDEHPRADIRLFEDEQATMAKLRAGELDLAFLVEPVDDDLAFVSLFADPYVLVAQRGEFPPGTVALDNLNGVAMVAFPHTCDFNRVETSLAARGIQPVVVFRTVDNGAVLAMVRAGMGAALMPLLAVSLDDDDDALCLHRLDPPIEPRLLCMVWPAGRTLSPLAARVVEIVTELAGTFDAQHRHRWQSCLT